MEIGDPWKAMAAIVAAIGVLITIAINRRSRVISRRNEARPDFDACIRALETAAEAARSIRFNGFLDPELEESYESARSEFHQFATDNAWRYGWRTRAALNRGDKSLTYFRQHRIYRPPRTPLGPDGPPGMALDVDTHRIAVQVIQNYLKATEMEATLKIVQKRLKLAQRV